MKEAKKQLKWIEFSVSFGSLQFEDTLPLSPAL
jgi:hypothetical protein